MSISISKSHAFVSTSLSVIWWPQDHTWKVNPISNRNNSLMFVVNAFIKY